MVVSLLCVVMVTVVAATLVLPPPAAAVSAQGEATSPQDQGATTTQGQGTAVQDSGADDQSAQNSGSQSPSTQSPVPTGQNPVANPQGQTANTQGNLSGCGSLPVVADACQKLADSTSWVTDCSQSPEGCGQSINDTVVAGAFDYFARWVAVGALATIDMQWEAITNTTTPSLSGDSSVLRTSLLTARALAFPLLVAAGLYSLLKRDAQIAIKSALLYLPGSVIGMMIMGFALQFAIEVTDTLSLNYVSDTKFGVLEWLLGLEDTIVAGVGVTAPVLLVIFSVVLMAASLLLWLIMLVRSAVIMVVYVFMPLAFAAMIFPSTRGWIKRLIEVELSFILAKPVIMAVLALGASTLNEAENAMVAMMQASALFFLASFAPFALMKLLPIVSDQAVAAIEGPALAPRRTAANALGTVGVVQATRFLAGSQHDRAGDLASPSMASDTGTSGGSGGSLTPSATDAGGTHMGGALGGTESSGGDPATPHEAQTSSDGGVV